MERMTGFEPALSAWELLEPMGMCLVPCEFRGPERPGVSLGCLPQMTRQWHAENRLQCPRVPACKVAAESPSAVAEHGRGAPGGYGARLMVGSLPTFAEYGCGHTRSLVVLSIAAPISQLPYKSRTVARGGITITTTKTRRLELRTDEATDQLISQAAELLHVTKSAFVADAARMAAEKIVARSDVTLMSPTVFDTMMASLDIPDESPELAKLAKLPRLITS